MGKVLMLVAIYPKEGCKLEDIIEKLKQSKSFTLDSFERLPLAFGIEFLKVRILVADEAGAGSKAEEEISKMECVSNVNVEMVSRV